MSANRDVDVHPSLLPSRAPRTFVFHISEKGSVFVMGSQATVNIATSIVFNTKSVVKSHGKKVHKAFSQCRMISLLIKSIGIRYSF